MHLLSTLSVVAFSEGCLTGSYQMPLKGKASDDWTACLVIYPKEIIGPIHTGYSWYQCYQNKNWRLRIG